MKDYDRNLVGYGENPPKVQWKDDSQNSSAVCHQL